MGPALVAPGTGGRRSGCGLADVVHRANVKADALGTRRLVVRVQFIDLQPGGNLWWIVNQDGGNELCIQDPGFDVDVDLYLACTLRDMIYVVRGDLSLAWAIATDRLDVTGPAAMRRKLAAWLNLGPLTRIKSRRPDAVAP